MPRGKVEEPVDDGPTIGTATEEPELFPGEGPTIVQEWVEQNKELFTRESLERSRESLHSKLSQIYAAVGRIAKTGKAPASIGGFSFVEAANVAEVIRTELSLRRITMMPTSMELIDVRPTPKSALPVETWRVSWTFTDGETGESFTIQSVGSGTDSLDKGAPKAQTNAMKYALLMAFLIPTGDDPERFDPEDETKGPINITASSIPGIKPGGRQGEITAAQYEAIRSRAKTLQLDPLGMKQVIEHALKEMNADGEEFSIPGWPAGGTIDEQRDQVLRFLSETTFDQAASILAELHGEAVE